jgi:PIN domain nuclease of toxin-antitoxin system
VSRGFLLDTHALLWWLVEAESLSGRSFDMISDGTIDIYVSAVSPMEIGTKWRNGKLAEGEGLVRHFDKIVAEEGFYPLPISLEHADLAATTDFKHADPWDRLLYAQAKLEDLTLMTCDRAFRSSDLATFW